MKNPESRLNEREIIPPPVFSQRALLAGVRSPGIPVVVEVGRRQVAVRVGIFCTVRERFKSDDSKEGVLLFRIVLL